MFNNLEHILKKTNIKARNCKLQRRFQKKCEDSECLPTALRGIPKTSEDFPTATKILGLLQEYGSLKLS